MKNRNIFKLTKITKRFLEMLSSVKGTSLIIS